MKLSLQIKSGSLGGQSFELTEGNLTIGRGENCRVRFDPFGEKIASKHHAFIELKPDGFYLTDFNSTNGTFLNGLQISNAKLKSGDTIQFGKNGVEAAISISETLSQSQTPTIAKPLTEAEFLGRNSEATVVKSHLPLMKSSNEQTAVYQRAVEPPFHPPQFAPNFPLMPANLRNSFSGIGMGGVFQPQQPIEDNTQKYLSFGLGIFAVVFLFLVVMLRIILPNLGVGTAIVASFVAFMPAMFYILPLIWLDRYDPEPIWLIGLAFAWGALVSVIFSYFINTAFAEIAIAVLGVKEGMALTGIISAPIFEEASKGLGVVLLLIAFRKYFDDILDGIVFAGTIALGFATVENVLYYGGAIITGGSDALVALFILRGIFSPFAHVTFTAMTGIGCGISRESHNPLVRILMPLLGYTCAVLLHFIWNLMATIMPIEGFLEGDWWKGYILLQFPFFVIFTVFAITVMFRQNRIIKEMLAIDVAQGLISDQHQRIATSAFRSTGWLIESVFSGRFGARSKYLRAVGKLGLSYWHIQRANAAKGQTGSYQQNPILRAEVLKWRDKV
ncbi:hypothetical protein BH10ACI1_BH10ACI1_21230 [soil metagenome]